MSKFVNYNKRGVTLPPGCKNLIDLLQPQRPRSHSIVPSEPEPTVTREESGMVTVAELGNYVTMLFQGSARGGLLTLSFPDERLTIYFAHHSGELMHASVNFQEDAQRERLMRAFFVDQGLQLPSDDWTPITQFIPGVPVQSIYRISPLPPDATTASNLAAELFRQVCGLSDNDCLSFSYLEMEMPL